ncbi:polysaccharide deacetylase family protein [Mucilaginibacter sp. RCC_168]|uniref:polysaccharide deacetylase family protein n=1 Tax=Mucilaginibacter sp. RCC_168 TaxID=3239221 RepID=UPI0035267F2F
MYISLTFDDGWKSQYSNALPILEKNKIKATFYIITESLYTSAPAYMNRAQILVLNGKGHEIGSHSVTHPNLAFLWNCRQIWRSSNDLKINGLIPDSFSYPYGRNNWILQKLVKKCGYQNARADGNTFNKKKFNKYAVHARYVKNTTSVGEVRLWIAEAKNNLLVLSFHQIEENPGEWGCSPALLETICRIIKESSLIVLPLTEAINRFSSGN